MGGMFSRLKSTNNAFDSSIPANSNCVVMSYHGRITSVTYGYTNFATAESAANDLKAENEMGGATSFATTIEDLRDLLSKNK